MNSLSKKIAIAVFLFSVTAVSVEAAVVKVTPRNLQAAIDALPETTPESSKPKSIQAIVSDPATYVGEDDAIEFAPGIYDDMGELILGAPLTLRKDPTLDGDAVLTGEMLIHIRSKGVTVEGLTFRDLEIDKVTLMRRGETADRDAPTLTGPIEVYLSEVNIASFLLDRKAKVAADSTPTNDPCPDSLPDCRHDYSSYTGQLTREELTKHISTPTRYEYDPSRLIVNDKGIPMTWRGEVARYTNKWIVFAQHQNWVGEKMAHVLINPRYYGGESSCPAAENLTGIKIVRNSFEGTEFEAIRSMGPGQPVPRSTAGSCFVEVEITGNTFRNIGVPAYAFIRDSDGDFITDDAGRKIPSGYGELTQYAIGLQSFVRKAEISDNTFEGATHNDIQIWHTPEGGRITIRNNEIRNPSEGMFFQKGKISVRGTADDVKVSITGNRLLGSDDSYPYVIHRYGRFRRRAGWCTDPVIAADATVAQVQKDIDPRIWQSYVPGFPYPGGEGPELRMPPDGPSVELSDLLDGWSGDYTAGHTDVRKRNVVIGFNDVVRHKRCGATTRIDIVGQKGVSVTNNDLGYGEEGFIDYAIGLYGENMTLAGFSGNNIENYARGVIGLFDTNGMTMKLNARGNYLGVRPILSNLNGDGLIAEPIARGEGDVGPRPGMTAENPPELPRIERASLTGGNMIVVTYNAELDEESTPPASAFTVRYQVEDARFRNVGVSSISVSGKTVTLTLASEIPDGASGLTVVYTAPGGAAAVRSEQGNIAARNQDFTITDDGGDIGEPPPGGAQPGSGGDGGCALAFSGKDGIGLGVFVLPLILMVAAFVFRPQRRD